MNGQLEAKVSPYKASCLVHRAVFVIGAETTDIINVGVTLKDALSQVPGGRAGVFAYLSDDANGDTVTGTTPTSVAIGTNGLAIAMVAGKAWQITTEADGTFDLNIQYTGGAATYYLAIRMPDGRLVVSDAITFA